MVASTVCRAGGVLAGRKEVRAMWTFILSIVAAILLCSFCLCYVFMEDISAYLKAKTEEVKAMTELIRKEKGNEHS